MRHLADEAGLDCASFRVSLNNMVLDSGHYDFCKMPRLVVTVPVLVSA